MLLQLFVFVYESVEACVGVVVVVVVVPTAQGEHGYCCFVPYVEDVVVYLFDVAVGGE